MKKTKAFLARHKTQLIIGGLIVGGVVTYLVTRKPAVSYRQIVETVTVPTEEEWFWNFENIDAAIPKFKELEELCIKAVNHEVAIFGGGGPNAGKCTVMFLTNFKKT